MGGILGGVLGVVGGGGEGEGLGVGGKGGVGCASGEVDEAEAVMPARVTGQDRDEGLVCSEGLGVMLFEEGEVTAPEGAVGVLGLEGGVRLGLNRRRPRARLSSACRKASVRPMPSLRPDACPTHHHALGLSIPCIVSQLTKALNQPVLVVSLGYMPKPCPPCS